MARGRARPRVALAGCGGRLGLLSGHPAMPEQGWKGKMQTRVLRDLGFRVYKGKLGFRVQGLGFRVAVREEFLIQG